MTSFDHRVGCLSLFLSCWLDVTMCCQRGMQSSIHHHRAVNFLSLCPYGWPRSLPVVRSNEACLLSPCSGSPRSTSADISKVSPAATPNFATKTQASDRLIPAFFHPRLPPGSPLAITLSTCLACVTLLVAIRVPSQGMPVFAN
jgi:hypothetical protein